MLKVVTLCILAILTCTSVALSAESARASKGFDVTFSVLTALHYANWAREYALHLGEDTDLGAMMKNLMLQNAKFQQGLAVVEEYMKDPDKPVSVLAEGMSAAMLIHMEENEKVIELLKQVSNGDFAAFKDLEYRLAQRAATQKQAWEMMATSATLVVHVLVKPAESLSPKGPIPFRVNRNERLQLSGYLNQLFRDDLIRYYRYRQDSANGRPTNPNDQTWIIFTVDHIRKTLDATNYEDNAREAWNVK